MSTSWKEKSAEAKFSVKLKIGFTIFILVIFYLSLSIAYNQGIKDGKFVKYNYVEIDRLIYKDTGTVNPAPYIIEYHSKQNA